MDDVINPVINTNKIIVAGQGNEITAFILENEQLMNKKKIGSYLSVYPDGDCNGFGIADFDQDGDFDIITGSGVHRFNVYFGFISLFIQHKDKSFTQIDIDVPETFNYNLRLMDVTILHYNEDLYPDFIISGDRITPYLFINNKNNTFTMIQLTSADNNLRAKAIGDFNEDGYMDIVMGDVGNNVYIYENNKQGGFIKHVPFQVNANYIYGLATGDFNEDGHDDIIVCGTDGKIWLYAGDGYINFNLIKQDIFPATSIQHFKPVLEMGQLCSIDTIDINKDGHLDLIIQKKNGQIYFSYGTGNGDFNTPIYKDYSNYYNYANSISAPFKYVDPDDIPVAKITQPAKGDIKTFVGQEIEGIATTKDLNDFQEYILEYGYGESPDNWNVIISSTNPIPYEDEIISYWYPENLNGIYTLRLTVKSKKGYTAYDTVVILIAIRKITNDKFIVIGQENGEIYYMIDKEDSSFNNKILVDQLNSLVFGVAVSDIDNDKDLDILALEKEGNIYVYVNDGSQNFVKKTVIEDLSVYSDAMDIWTGIFRTNGGYPDLLSSQNNNIPLIYKNEKFHGLWIKKFLPPGDILSRIRRKTVQDFNNDGKKDFISIDYEGNVYLYINQSSDFEPVKFTNYKLLTITNTILPYTFISGDYDEDGIYDLVIGGAEDGDTYFYKGSTNGIINFTLQTNFTVFDFNEETASFSYDFNDDGYLDIIAVTYKSNKLWYLPGEPGREFGNSVIIDNNVPSALGISGVDYWGNTYPQAVINQPSRDDNINGYIHISGVAYDSDFKEYFLEYGFGYTPTNWALINYDTNVVFGGELGVWDSTSLPTGVYSVRLTVIDMSNLISSDIINVNLVPPRAYITIQPESPICEGTVTVILSNDKPAAFAPELYYQIIGKTEKHYITLSATNTNNDLWVGSFIITTNSDDDEARFYYRGEDNFGNVGIQILEGEYFEIDTTKPNIKISFITPPPLDAGYHSITIIASESLDLIDELYFIPNNSTNKIYVGNLFPSGINQYSGLLPITSDLSNGPAEFYFIGNDKTCNVGSQIISNEIFVIAIDKIPPIAEIIFPASNENVWGLVQIIGTAIDEDYYGTTNNFDNYRLEYGEGNNPVQRYLIGDPNGNSVYSNLLEEWDTSDLSGYYTIKLTVFDGSGNSAEDSVLVWLNNVHHFNIEHDGEGYAGTPEQIVISVRDRNDNIITNFNGVVTIDTSEGNTNAISWSNISGNGNFVDEGAGSDKAIYEFISADKGVVTLTIIDVVDEILDIRVKNQQAEDDDTEGLLHIIAGGIKLLYPQNDLIISDIMPTFKWEIPAEENNKNLYFKIEIADSNIDFTNNIIFSYESKESTRGFSPVPPVFQGKNSQYFTIYKKLEYNAPYYWKVTAWNGQEYYIDSPVWEFEIRK